MGDEDGGAPPGGAEQGGSVLELGRNVHVDGQLRQFLEPVARHPRGVVRGAATDQDQAIDVGEPERQVRRFCPHRTSVEEGTQGVADHDRLLVDLLLHVVPVAAFPEGGRDDA